MSNDDRLKNYNSIINNTYYDNNFFCTITIIEKLDLVQHSPSLVRIVG